VKFKALVVIFPLLALTGCAATSLSEQSFGTKLPKYKNTTNQNFVKVMIKMNFRPAERAVFSRPPVNVPDESLICIMLEMLAGSKMEMSAVC